MDDTGTLTTINRVARKILGCDKDGAVGRTIAELGWADSCLGEAFNQQCDRNEKRNIITDKGRFQYFSTCKPIRSTPARRWNTSITTHMDLIHTKLQRSSSWN